MKNLNKLIVTLTMIALSGVTYSQFNLENKVTASDGEFQDHFGGHPGGVDIYGDFAVVGAHWTDVGVGVANEDFGSVYIYQWRDELCQWVQTDIIEAESADGTPDGQGHAHFGEAVSIYENTVVIGAPDYDFGPLNSGMVYVYDLDASGIATFSERLFPFDNSGTTDIIGGAHFGCSVKIGEDRIVVGAFGNDTDEMGVGPAVSEAGAAYIYEEGTFYMFEQKIVALDREPEDLFGTDVSIKGSVIIIGAPGEDEVGAPKAGAAYVFMLSGTWAETQKLVAPVREEADLFGSAVDIEQVIVISAPNEDEDAAEVTNRIDAGSAYVFGPVGPLYLLNEKIVANDADRKLGDRFGTDIDITGNRIVVGAPFYELPVLIGEPSIQDAGAAFVFEYDGGWMQTHKLTAFDQEIEDFYGSCAAISNERVIVGAFARDEIAPGVGVLQADLGACYIYRDSIVPVIYSVNASPSAICSETDVVLSVDGNLFDGTDWVWYNGPCEDGFVVGEGESITVSPTETTTYCVQAIGCYDFADAPCECIEVTVSNGHWHQTTGAGIRDVGNDVAVDSEGNVYVTGQYHDKTSFPGGDNLTVNIDDGPSSTSVQSYVTKYDNCGNLLWVAHSTFIAGSGDNSGTSIVVDESGTTGHVYVSGNFSNSIRFQGGFGDFGVVGPPKDASFAGNRGYVVRLDMETGTVDYIDAISLGNTTTAQTITINELSGRIYVGGEYRMTGGGNNSVYVRSYDPSAISIESNIWQIEDALNFEPMKRLNDLDFDENSNALWMIGNYSGTLALNYSAPVINSSMPQDAFVARYLDLGLTPFSSSVRTGNILGEMTGEGIAVGETFGAYLTGGYRGLSSGAFGTPQTLPMFTQQYAYFVALDNSLSPLWSNAGVAGPLAKGLGTVNKGGRTYFTGEYGDMDLTFSGVGGITLPYEVVSCTTGAKHTFAVSYNAIGFTTMNWANGTTDALTCSNIHIPGGIDVDDNGHAFIAGTYSGEMGYISGVPESGNLTATAQSNMYAMRVDLSSATGEFKNNLEDDNTEAKFEGSDRFSFTLSPNPAVNSTLFELSEFEPNKNYKLRLVSPTGQIIHEKGLNSKLSKLDLSDLAKGTYYVIISEDTGIQKTLMLVIE